MQLPKAVRNLIEAFERLPGIGPKTAARLTYHLLHSPKAEVERLAAAAAELKSKTTICQTCKNFAEVSPCNICSDDERDKSVICVVETPLDAVALEKSASFTGLYHILHGKISPLSNMGPDDIFIADLLPRLADGVVKEVILATNPGMEGEATAMYIQRLIKGTRVKITRIGLGLPTGGEIEFADEVTIRRAIEGRREY